MAEKSLLIIFVKNPVPGKCKTRLAQAIGNEKAMIVYIELQAHTHLVTKNLKCDKAVYYSATIDMHDIFMSDDYEKYLQHGDTLGKKMYNAFKYAFAKGYKSVAIIGSDCYELTEEIVQYAFHWLDEKDVVIGPAEDGGYYLLGMNFLIRELFEEKEWSSENVLLDTLLDLKKLNLSYELLPTLSDVDREEDLGQLRRLLDD